MAQILNEIQALRRAATSALRHPTGTFATGGASAGAVLSLYPELRAVLESGHFYLHQLAGHPVETVLAAIVGGWGVSKLGHHFAARGHKPRSVVGAVTVMPIAGAVGAVLGMAATLNGEAGFVPLLIMPAAAILAGDDLLSAVATSASPDPIQRDSDRGMPTTGRDGSR